MEKKIKSNETEHSQVFAVEMKNGAAKFTRRDFLKAAGATASAAALAGCAPATTPAPTATATATLTSTPAPTLTPTLTPTPTQTPLPTLDAPACRGRSHTSDVGALAISPDGKILVSGAWDRSIKFWSLPDGTLLKTPDAQMDRVTSLAFHPNGRSLASGASDGVIQIWLFPEGELLGCAFDLASSPPGSSGMVYQMTVDGQLVEYTLPCGEPLPPGAVCTCNCVAGGYAPPCSCDVYSDHYWYPN